MSSFWSGVIGAIIGAVVGGAFTGWAGWLQSRGAFRAAEMQIRESLKNERIARSEGNRASALIEINKAANDLFETIEVIEDKHPMSAHSCPKTYKAPAALAAKHKAMMRLYSIYVYILPDAVGDAIDMVSSSAKELMKSSPGHSPLVEHDEAQEVCQFCPWSCNIHYLEYVHDRFFGAVYDETENLSGVRLIDIHKGQPKSPEIQETARRSEEAGRKGLRGIYQHFRKINQQ